MATLGQLVERVRHTLTGNDMHRDAVTSLTAALGVSDLTLSIADAGPRSGASEGLAEVGTELMRVAKVDANAAKLLLHPFGRGYRGTTPSVHGEGSEVRFNPRWPTATLIREINSVIVSLYPLVYGVAEHTGDVSASEAGIDVPSIATGIISVWVEDGHGGWQREDRWAFNRDSTTSGRPLRIGGLPRAGESVRVVYSKRPTVFDEDLGADFTTTTGLDERCQDLLAFGVAARLAPMFDFTRLAHNSAEAREKNQSQFTGGSTARLMEQLFRQAVDREAAVLAREHPIRVHRER